MGRLSCIHAHFSAFVTVTVRSDIQGVRLVSDDRAFVVAVYNLQAHILNGFLNLFVYKSGQVGRLCCTEYLVSWHYAFYMVAISINHGWHTGGKASARFAIVTNA